MTHIKQVLDRVGTIGDKNLMLFLAEHAPIIKHGGDQRDPTEEIACTCRKHAYLDVPYYIHIYDEIRKADLVK